MLNKKGRGWVAVKIAIGQLSLAGRCVYARLTEDKKNTDHRLEKFR